MKKYIKPSMEVTEVMLESPILAASNGGVSDTLGKQEVDGTSLKGAHILRVHDVREAVEAVKIVETMKMSL